MKLLWILTVAALLASAPVSAHHSFAAEYESGQMITLTGKITKVEWTNPHIYVHMDVADPSGKAVSWSVEGYPPNTLKRTGVPRSMFKEGDTITVTAYKSKDGSNTGAGREVTFQDKSKKFMGPVGR
jgi:hypothetical protein